MKDIIIIGAGGHSAELCDYINYINRTKVSDKIKVSGIIDDDKNTYDHYEFEAPYLGKIEGYVIDKNVDYLMGIANLSYRKPIIEQFLKQGANFISLIHPTALVSPSARIGQGVVISHNASVGPKVEIGDFNVLNSRCTIGHDSKLGDYNFISPQVAISGNTTIGDENLIGTNACTIPGMSIGNNNKIAAGMVVYKPVGDNETVMFRHKERIVIKNK